MSAHVPAEMPLGRAVRYAASKDGTTCTVNAAVSSVPRPARPVAHPVPVSAAAHTPVTASQRGSSCCLPASTTVSTPARKVTEQDGIRAVQ